MAKRRHRAVPVKEIEVGKLVEAIAGERVVVAIDIAMEWMYAAIASPGDTVHATVKWNHPRETVALAACRRARAARSARGGDGGDEQALAAEGRTMVAALKRLEVHDKAFRCNRNRLTAALAKYWPEVRDWLSLDSATLLELLSTYGGPEAVGDDVAGVRRLMRSTGRGRLAEDKIDGVLASASATLGVPMVAEEQRVVIALAAAAAEAQRSRQEPRQTRQRLKDLSGQCESTRAMASVTGGATAAVLVAPVGDPCDYGSAKAWLKAMGLNLREHSSGKKEGGLHITKRGSGIARMYLFMAAMRLILQDPVVHAWCARKVERQGGTQRVKAVVAVMRKLSWACGTSPAALHSTHGCCSMSDASGWEVRCREPSDAATTCVDGRPPKAGSGPLREALPAKSRLRKYFGPSAVRVREASSRRESARISDDIASFRNRWAS